MSMNAKITCDVCGVEKKEANHWFTGSKSFWGGIKFDRWNYDHPAHNLSADFHLCGEQCCLKKFSEWINVPTNL